MYNVIMQYLNSFLLCSIRNLTSGSLSRLFTIKIDVFSFLKVLIQLVVFNTKAITENQLHDFLITVDILARNIVYTIADYEELQSP